MRNVRVSLALGTLALSLSLFAVATDGFVRLGSSVVSESELEWLVERCPEGVASCLEGKGAFPLRLSREAEARKLDRSPNFVALEERLLADELTLALPVPEPSPEEIAKYRAENLRDFERPLRIHLLRHLAKIREASLEVLEKLGKKPTPTAFRELCRTTSSDKATKERGGDLGMVWPDGTTDVPQVRTDPALYATALSLAEGELAKEPIPEGDGFALVWRRDSLPPESKDATESSRLIRGLLREKALATARDTLVTTLRKEKLRDHHPEFIDKLKFAAK